MTIYHRGDVVLVPFDFTDRSGSKRRPAVVVSIDRYNQGTPDVLIAAVTGNLSAIPHPGDYQLTDWQAAGLVAPSVAQTKIAAIEARLIVRKLGTLTDADLTRFEAGLREALGL